MDLECILTPLEIEFYVSSLQPTKIEALATRSWFEKHEKFQKLYQQAVLEASKCVFEQVKDDIITNQKLQVFVYEAILISVWKQRVLPRILKMHPEAENTFPVYMILYHEATVIGLLQTILYHPDCCESLGDAAVELVDYAVSTLTRLAISCKKNEEFKLVRSNVNNLEELNFQERTLLHGLASSCVSIIRYLVENLESIPVTVATRLYSDNDVPLLLCELMNQNAWTKMDPNGVEYKYTEGEWKKVDDEQELTKTEIQLWLTVHQILLNKYVFLHYEITNNRRNQFIKLQRYLNDVLIDQLPPLIDLKRWLCQVSVSNPPAIPSKKLIIMDISSHYRQNLETLYSNKWDDIADQQACLLFKISADEIQHLASSLSSVFGALPDVCEASPKCSNCGEPAKHKCSSCKNEWYCRRECQVKQWKNHKHLCNILSKSKEN